MPAQIPGGTDPLTPPITKTGETAGLEAYLNGGSHEEPLQAAGKVIDCKLPIDPAHADRISKLTDHLDIEIETCGDAALAIRRWFATMREPGARH